MSDSRPSENPEKKKPLMRSLGEFVGHIWGGVKHNPNKDRHTLETKVREEKHGNVTLRETVIREIEVDRGDGQ